VTEARSPLVVREPTREELRDVAVLAAALVRLHHTWDAARFFVMEPIEAGYERFLASQLGDARTVILAALLEGRVVGYTYARFEDRDWNLLLDAHGAIHDVYVDADARRTGVAKQLVLETIARLEAMGAQRVVLSTARKNEAGQRLFAALGFRETMIEMTRERSSAP